jgi:hypothetical protein
MTAEPEQSTLDLGLPSELPLVAKELKTGFSAPNKQLRMFGALLFGGEIPLHQRNVAFAPFIGHTAQRMRAINQMAANGNRLALHERRLIAEYHAARYTTLVRFLRQFPPDWQRLLLATARDELTGIELKAARDNRVVEVVVWSERTLYEYGLRAFNLSFIQLRQIAAWMRENEDLLPTAPVRMPRGGQRNTANATARTAALTQLFAPFPEKMRDLLVAKARPELTDIHFETSPMGDVVLRVHGHS